MRILLATGGSAYSEPTLTFGAHLAKRTTTPPTVLTVVKKEADRPRAEEIVSRARELLRPTLGEVPVRIRVGHPAEEIIGEAEEGDYDLVLVGEKQHQGLVTRFVLGSTAVRVVEHAPCPVVVAKGRMGPVNRILLCDSGAPVEPLLTRLLDQLGGLLHAEDEVTILHVMSQLGAGPGRDEETRALEADAETLIEQAAPEGQLLERGLVCLEGHCVHATPLVRHGLVVEEILAEAREGDYDLVVIGTHTGSGWRRILLDDVAHEIVVRTDRPVLVVR